MPNSSRIELIRTTIRDVPDFPKPGIVFKDITPLLADPKAFNACLDLLAEYCDAGSFDAVAGVESRGFIFGAPLAARLDKPFIPVRKPGKLPCKTLRIDYELEYGTDTLEVHSDAVSPGARVLIIDDLLATGGTAGATVELVRLAGAKVAAVAFVIELSFLNGRARFSDVPVHSLLTY